MRDIALTAVILGLLPVCAVRPWIGVLAWYWFGLMNPHMFTWGFGRGFPYAMLIALATLAGALIARDRRPIPWNRELAAVAALMAYFTVTTLLAWEPDEAWRYWRQFAKVLLMTFVATMFIYGRSRVRALMLVVGLSLGFYGIKGMIFVLRSGGAFSVQGPEGVFIGGNTFIGLALNMVVPVLICLARDEKDKRLRLFLNFAAASCAVASVFTYSRGALVGLVVVLPLLFMKSPRKAWGSMIFLLAAMWLVVYVAPEGLWRRAQTIQTYEEDLSAMARLRSWSVAWNIAKDRPLTGAGFQFEYSSDRARWFSYADERFKGMAGGTQSAHSVYFQVLGQHGFIALGLYLLLMASTIITLRNLGKRARAAPGAEWVATYSDGLRIGIIAFAISGAFLNAAYFDLYYIFIGLTAILSREFSSAQVPVHVAVPSVATASPSQGLEDARRI